MNPERKSDIVVRDIKRFMERRGLSVSDVSKAANISCSTLYSIFNGSSSPRFDTLQEVCNAMNIEIGLRGIANSQDEIFKRKFSHLSKDEKVMVMRLINFFEKSSLKGVQKKNEDD